MLMLVVVTLAMSAGAVLDKKTTIVEVAGSRYRVTTVGTDVTVAKKAMMVHFNLAERDAQREAVKKATGCVITDELQPNDARLRGKLDCSQRAGF